MIRITATKEVIFQVKSQLKGKIVKTLKSADILRGKFHVVDTARVENGGEVMLQSREISLDKAVMDGMFKASGIGITSADSFTEKMEEVLTFALLAYVSQNPEYGLEASDWAVYAPVVEEEPVPVVSEHQPEEEEEDPDPLRNVTLGRTTTESEG